MPPRRLAALAALVAVVSASQVAPAFAADWAPIARLSVWKSATSPLTVTADASRSTDTDSTPIAKYRFRFGDGTATVTTSPPKAKARHTYAADGTYVVTLRVTDGAGNRSDPARVRISVTTPPPERSPVAELTVSKSTTNPLKVTADASGSTDIDSTPIGHYRFDFGDGTSAVTTSPPTASAEHTYAGSGTYTVTLTVTDTAGNVSAPATKDVTVTAGPPVAVYVGYYDTHHSHNTQPKPDPWKGDSGVVFVGQADTDTGKWDSSTVRVENLTGSSISGVVVTVDIGSHHYALWGTNSIPSGESLVLAQTGTENFDGSDTSPAGCYGCDPDLCDTSVSSTVPEVHVDFDGKTTDYADTNQVLNTKGADGAGCPYTGTRNDESHDWQRLAQP